MERHCRDLEREPRREQPHGDEEQRTASIFAQGRGDRGEVRRARDSVGEADPEQEQGGGEGCDQEVLDRGLVGRRPIHRDPDQDDRAERGELQTEIEGQEIDGRDGEHHPRRGEQQESVVLAPWYPFALEAPRGQERGQCERGGDDHLEEPGVAVDRDHPPETGGAVPGNSPSRGHHRGQRGDDRPRQRQRRRPDPARCKDENERRADEDQLRDEQAQIRGARAIHGAPPAARSSATGTRRYESTSSG
jgi:hypothetical protein